MKSNVIHLSACLAAFAAIGILPSRAAVGTALTQNPRSIEDQTPKAVSQPKPVYSCYLRRAAIEGQVVVAFTVTPLGDVVNARIVSSTDRLFDAPTLDAIAKWRFMPAMKSGLPVSANVRELVAFSIPDAPR
jgi:TonB family protein